jgi:solute carrier family 25, member 42
MRLTEQHLTNRQLLISGAFSGALAKTCIAPFDRIKINFQTNPSRIYSVKNALSLGSDIVKHGGITSLWRGNLATMIRVMPYAAVNFTIFSRTKDKLNTMEYNIHPIAVRFIAGATSGAIATFITYPLETLRARMAVQDINSARMGYLNSVLLMIQKEGVNSLYAGLKPTLLGIVPYAGISFTTYETFKGYNKFLAGAIAGIVAQSATYPLDVVRRRMQVHPMQYTSFTETLKLISKNEGIIKGLYKGLSMNWFKGPIAVSISLITNDFIKDHLFSN